MGLLPAETVVLAAEVALANGRARAAPMVAAAVASRSVFAERMLRCIENLSLREQARNRPQTIVHEGIGGLM
jgi:hypothetical protein